MKTTSLFALSTLALSSALMADIQLVPAKPAQEAVEIVPDIAICREAPVHIDQRFVSRRISPVRQLRDMEANEESIQSILQNEKAKTTIDKLKAPIVLKSMEDALKHLTRDSMEKIEVDFDKSQLAIFAWQGSGQDRLGGHFSVNKAKANIANMHYTPGRTKDLRTHSVIYTMPKDSEIVVNNLEARIIRCGVGVVDIKPVPQPLPHVVPDCDLQVLPQPKVQLQVMPLKKAE